MAAECLVAEHLVGKMAELDVKTQVMIEACGHCSDKPREDGLAHVRVLVFAFAVDSPVGVNGRGQNGTVKENVCQHMCHNMSVSIHRDSHAWLLHGCRLQYAEELHAVEEILARHSRQFR